MMNPFEILKQLFEKKGFEGDGFSVLFENQKINIEISKKEDGDYMLSFMDSKPTIKVKKLITLSFSLSGITLKEDGGILHVNFWPDLPFKYNWFFTQEIQKE